MIRIASDELPQALGQRVGLKDCEQLGTIVRNCRREGNHYMTLWQAPNGAVIMEGYFGDTQYYVVTPEELADLAAIGADGVLRARASNLAQLADRRNILIERVAWGVHDPARFAAPPGYDGPCRVILELLYACGGRDLNYATADDGADVFDSFATAQSWIARDAGGHRAERRDVAGRGYTVVCAV